MRPLDLLTATRILECPVHRSAKVLLCPYTGPGQLKRNGPWHALFVIASASGRKDTYTTGKLERSILKPHLVLSIVFVTDQFHMNSISMLSLSRAGTCRVLLHFAISTCGVETSIYLLRRRLLLQISMSFQGVRVLCVTECDIYTSLCTTNIEGKFSSKTYCQA